MGGRRMGVEEELLVVAADGSPRGMSASVLAADASLEGEIRPEQVETATVPCTDTSALADELRARRRAASEAARAAGVEVAALATPPVPVASSQVAPKHRYEQMVAEYGRVASDQLTCGCHVHVEVSSPEEGVGVLDRIGPWLPVLRAVSANSPFWHGEDTGYASYRTAVWNRWPSAGPTGPFGSLAAYDELVAAMLDSGALVDEGMIYFDARLNRALSTVELRVADVCLDVDDAVLIAALARGLVTTAARGGPEGGVRPEVLSLAHWRAARSGLRGELVDPSSGRPAPAGAVLGALRTYVADAVADAGDTDLVDRGCARLLAEGTGSDQQRTLADARGGDLHGLVTAVVARTAPTAS